MSADLRPSTVLDGIRRAAETPILQRPEPKGCGCGSSDVASDLVTIDAALDTISRMAAPVPERQVLNLALARGRVLADAILAPAMSPPFDNSAMDGYALRTGDLTSDGPWTLTLQDRLAAGDDRQLVLCPGHAIRIFTGARMPAGADAVVMQEAITSGDGSVTFSRRPGVGQHIRRAGDDMKPGDVAVAAGRTLGARDIAAAAATGAVTVAVRRRIRVAILVTGEEVRTAGGALRVAQIWDVNTPMLASAIAGPDVDLVEIAQAGDRSGDLANRIRHLSRRTDVIVTTGGVSVGEEDHIPAAIRRAGGLIEFAGVAMKPGKPVSAGRVGRALWLGLPGNPVSAFVAWTLFGTHLLGCLTGASDAAPRRHVVTGQKIAHKPGRCELRPATLAGCDALGRDVIAVGQTTHSARVRTLALTDGLAMIPADSDGLPAGSLVEFIPFWGGY